MKKNIYKAIALLALSSSSFATTSGHGYTILDESIVSTPGFEFRVDSSKKQSNSNSKFNHKKSKKGIQPPDILHTETYGSDRTGTVGHNIYIEGHHYVYVRNETCCALVLEYTYNLDCEESHGTYTRHVQVERNGTFYTDDHTYGVVQKFVPGKYPIKALTTFKSTRPDIEVGIALAENTLTVNPEKI